MSERRWNELNRLFVLLIQVFIFIFVFFFILECLYIFWLFIFKVDVIIFFIEIQCIKFSLTFIWNIYKIIIILLIVINILFIILSYIKRLYDSVFKTSDNYFINWIKLIDCVLYMHVKIKIFNYCLRQFLSRFIT